MEKTDLKFKWDGLFKFLYISLMLENTLLVILVKVSKLNLQTSHGLVVVDILSHEISV